MSLPLCLLLLATVQLCMSNPIPSEDHGDTDHQMTPEEFIANGGNADEYLEGDIIVPRTRNGVLLGSSKWRNGQIPYVLDSSLDANARAKIQQAINYYHQHTCIRWVPRTNQLNSVTMKKPSDQGCNSAVGKVNLGKQKINIPDWCVNSFGSLVHEMMHTIGFYHEQSRSDRDKYVTIYWDNIKSGNSHNFNRQFQAQTFGAQYDYGSLMHYSATAFSKDNKAYTIVPKNGVSPSAIGQRNGLSATDIFKINAMYGCKNTGGTGTGTQTGGSCADQNASCAGWAANGECQRNPNYMRSSCKKSCGLC